MDFNVADEVASLGVNVIFLSITSIDNSFFNQSLKDEIDNYYKLFSQKYTLSDFEYDPSILAYNKLHTRNFGAWL